MQKIQNILRSLAVDAMKLLCFLSFSSVLIFYVIYDESQWMDNFYFISDKLQVCILTLFLTLHQNKVVSMVAKCLFYISFVRLCYTIVNAFHYFDEKYLKLDSIALFIVASIILYFEWKSKRL